MLAWLAFGVDPAAWTIETTGLPDDPETAVRDAHLNGRRIRLVATAEQTPSGAIARVAPEYLATTDPLAAAVDEENVIQITSASNGTITLGGRGAGGAATAAAVLADLIHLFQPENH